MFKSNHTILNSDCTVAGKFDRLGRKRHIDMEKGRDHVALYTKQLNIKVDEEMFNRIRNGKVSSEKLRTYIEWGLENEE